MFMFIVYFFAITGIIFPQDAIPTHDPRPIMNDQALKKNPGKLLAFAAQQGDLEWYAKILTEHPMLDINIIAYEGRAALHHAIYYKKKSIIKELLHHPKININIKDRTNATPLMLAALRGDVETVTTLLNYKNIDLFAFDKHDRTALDYAYMYGENCLVGDDPDATAILIRKKLCSIHNAQQASCWPCMKKLRKTER